MPKTIISREIRRTIQTAPYESLVITEQLEEEIQWKTESEFNEKSQALRVKLIEQFKLTHDHELSELGFEKLAKYKKKFGSTEYKEPTKEDLMAELDGFDSF